LRTIIYLAHPVRHADAAIRRLNFLRAITFGRLLAREGYAPFVPGASVGMVVEGYPVHQEPFGDPTPMEICLTHLRSVYDADGKMEVLLPDTGPMTEGAVVFHSGWEIRFWAVCLRVGVPIRSYDGPDIQTSAGIYRPDFMVGDDLVVEVKGWEDRPGTPERLAESGVIMVGKEHLARLERLFDRDMFLAALTGG
jgi:hypothetical protein